MNSSANGPGFPTKSALTVLGIFMLSTGFQGSTISAPRPPQPPWPQATLRSFGFDSAYWNVPWSEAALYEEHATLAESWSGFSLTRDGFVTAPVVIPFETDDQRPAFAAGGGAVRFWMATSWSTASKESGGSGPGRWARLLELVNVSGKRPDVKWSLFVNAAGDTIYLGGPALGGIQAWLEAPVSFTAGDWRMVTLCYSPTNTELQIDNRVVARGGGVPRLAWWETNGLGLVIGSDVLASPESLAGAEFEEVTTLDHWPRKSDWQELYYEGTKRRSLLGPMGPREEEQAKVARLKGAGLLPANYGEARSSEEEEGPSAYGYAPESLWLEITGVTNDLAYLIVHGTVEAAAYELLSKGSMTNSEWAGEQVVLGAAGQDWTPTTVALGTRTNELFFWARTLADTDGDGLPDWWELAHGLDSNNPDTGGTGVSDGYKDGDSDGWTNLQEYQNGTNPGSFNTPPAPQGLAVTLTSGGAHASLTWQPAGGAVTGYTIERSFTNVTTQLSGSTTSLTDNAYTLPTGLYFTVPQYRIQANYAAGNSAWGPWTSSPQSVAPAASIVAASDGQVWFVAAKSPAAEPGALRGGQWYIGSPEYSITNFDLAVTAFTNGLGVVPEPFASLTSTGAWYAQWVYTNGVASAATPLGWSPTISFWDGRPQLKENLSFLLRAATVNYSFGYNYDDGETYPYFIGSPTEYAYAGLYETYFGEVSSGHPEAWLEPFRPFEENHRYRNFAFSATNLNSNGHLSTGVGWDSGQVVLNYPPLHRFVPPASPTAIASLLGPADTRWLYWHEFFPRSDSGWDEIGITLLDPGDDFVMATGYRNLFGLPYLSAKLAWSSGANDNATLNAGGTAPGYLGYFYPETEQPAFQTEGYYFAPFREYALADVPLPGHTTFSPTNTTPLLITSVGDPNFQLAGYAKLAVTNGYAGVYGYLGQYFDQAFKMSNGVVTTNETGLLSPYGEFFPTEPGQTALVTMPDLDTGERGTAVVYVVSMNLDANHDGVMDRTFAGPDQTSPQRPFQFWINNDNDSYTGEDYQATWRRDSDDNIVGHQRDLEDFARLWISGLPSLSTTNGYAVTIHWRNYTGNPTIKLYPAYEADGGVGYLQDTNVAFDQIQYANNYGVLSGPGACMATSAPSATFTFPANYSLTYGRKHFLFEAVERGTGELVLTVMQGTNTVVETSVFMDLRDVKEMYERWTVGEVGSIDPVNTPYPATDGLPVGASAFQYPHNPLTDTNTPYILHVHGWNMTTWSKNSYGESGFKRLFWQGYSGRYGIFRWPTYFNFPGLGFDLQAFDLNNYDKSEWQAWKSATGLRTLLTNLNTLYPKRVRVLGHSMGNVVASEALRINSNAPALAAVYVALEAAMPSHCFDAGATNRAIPFLLDHNTPNVYANFWQSGNSNYYHGFQGADAYVNFFNARDYALGKWQLDQNLKPAESLNYSFDETTQKYYRLPTEKVFPTDTHEIFSFCSEPRCYALGAQQNVGGVFARSMAIQVNLDATPHNFGDAVIGHSGQFRYRIQTCWPFWDELLKALELKSR